MLRLISCCFLLAVVYSLTAQDKVFPVIKSFGGIYEIPEATVLPDPAIDYKMVVDVYSGTADSTEITAGLYRLARMLNLFSVGGVPASKVDVVIAVHGSATYGILDNEAYQKRFGVDNPNLPLLRELQKAGVRLTVCGQSLIGRRIATASVADEVEIATSMLTTVATYQMRGYGVVRF